MSNQFIVLPDGWLWAKLRNISDIRHGYAFKSEDFGDTGAIVLTPGNFTEQGELDFINKRVVRLNGSCDAQWILNNGDLLIVMTDLSQKKLILGAAAILNNEETILHNQRIGLVVPYSNEISRFYLRYAILNPPFKKYIDSTATGTLITHTSPTKLLDGLIPLAPAKEQKRIVAKIEALRERSRRAREALFEIPGLCDRFRQSVLAAAFRGDLTADWRKQNQNAEWEEITLGDILKSKPRNGYSPKPVDYSTKVKSLTLTATTSGKFKPEHFKYIDEEIDQDSHLWLTPGDILIQRSNTLEYVGTCAIYDSNFGEFIYPDLMMKIQVIENKTKPEFIYYALSTETTRRYFKENATGTAGNMPKINQQVVMNTPIVLPSIEEQQEIIFRIQKLLKAADQIEQQYQEAKAYLDQLDQSILAKAFRGELVPQDPNDEPASVLLERIKAEREQLGEKKKTTRKSPTPRSRKPKTQTPTFEQMTLPGLDLEATEDVQ